MPSSLVEEEIKLRFDTPEEARAAVLAAGATPLRGRRLQEDCLLDTASEMLRRRRCALRVRLEGSRSCLTFKGPATHASVKTREELETVVGDASILLSILQELGFAPWFRYQKYREEFAYADLIVAVDETPVGTFVEIEGHEAGIRQMAQALGRSPSDYVLDSYLGLFLKHRADRGLTATDMLFEAR